MLDPPNSDPVFFWFLWKKLCFLSPVLESRICQKGSSSPNALNYKPIPGYAYLGRLPGQILSVYV